VASKVSSWEDISALKRVFYNDLIEGLESIEPRPGFLKVFREITDMGLGVAIASLTPRGQAEILLERSGVGKLFQSDRILLEDSVDKERLKPHPDVYILAAKLLGVDQKKMLVFEDSMNGILAALAAGCRVIAMPIYTFRANIKDLENAGALKIFSSWEDVDIKAILAELGDIEAIAFDMEGPILNVEDKHFEASRLAALEVGVVFDPVNTAEDIASKIHGAIGGGNKLISQGIWRLAGGLVE